MIKDQVIMMFRAFLRVNVVIQHVIYLFVVFVTNLDL